MVSKLGGVAYVSLQTGREAGSALDQHLAQGVLAAPGVVLLPDVAELDEKALTGAHVLVVVPGRRESQRIALRSLQAFVLDGRPMAGGARLTADVDPGTRPRRSSSEAFTRALEADGTIWPVLRPLVPEGSGPGSEPGRFLDGLPGGLPDAPELIGLERVELPDLHQIGWSICRLVPWCEPVDPWGGRG